MSEQLLEPVTAGQTRFRMPGLAPDGRGIAIGRETLLVVPSLAALVGFLGAYSDEASLDDLLPSMTIEQARRAGGGHALLVRCASGDGYFVDRLARLARAARGQVYTGGGTTFLRWRERDAPFGYDVVTPVGVGVDEVAVVDMEYQSRYTTAHRMDPVELLQRLELQHVPLPLGGISRDPELVGLKDMALVLVAPGLTVRVLRYLWRAEVAMAGCYVTLQGDGQSSLLLRLRQPQGRILHVLAQLPGVELLAPVSSRAAVQIGYRHPIALGSAQGCLPGDEMYLFRGSVGRVERIDGPPRFVDGRHLVTSGQVPRLRELGQIREGALEHLRVDLILRPSQVAREPGAVLIPWEQASMLRQLVYLLPPSALAVGKLVPLSEGLLVLTQSASLGRGNEAGASRIGAGVLLPLGRRLAQVAPGVLAPDGYELWPRLRPALLRSLLGLGAEDYAVYLGPEDDPQRIRPEQLLSLDAALIERVALHEPMLALGEDRGVAPTVIDHDRLGRFALWGVSGGPEAIPAGGNEDEGRG